MLDRTDDWEPLEKARFRHLRRRMGKKRPPESWARADAPIQPAPVDRIIRAIRSQGRD
jgi:hypothetical protein